MDMGLSHDPVESFKLFQGIIKEQYDSMAKRENFKLIDATRAINDMQQEVRGIVAQKLASYIPPSYSMAVPAGGTSEPETAILPKRSGRNGKSASPHSTDSTRANSAFPSEERLIAANGKTAKGR
jgi:hypothetical protein